MSDKKHIDRLFQEKFKDFEVTPHEDVWDAIEAKLNKKKKRRVIPIWWRYAGIAATLALLFTVSSLLFNSEDTNQPSNHVVETESPKTLETQQEDGNASTWDDKKNMLPQSENTIANAEKESDFNFNSSGNKLESSSDKKAMEGSVSSQTSNVAQSHYKANKNNAIKGSDTIIKTNTNPDTKFQYNEAIAENNSNAAKSYNDAENQIKNKTELDTEQARKTITGAKNPTENSIATKAVEATRNKEKSVLKDNLELTIEEAITETKDLDEEEKFNRWSIAPNAAPVYFNSLGEGSSLDAQFNSNSKTSELNMSYGVMASYAVNKRLTIRSGINKVRMGYNTNDVLAFQSIGPANSISSISSLKNVKSNFNIESASSTSFLSSDNIQSKSSGSLLNSVASTSLNQEFGFIEVPLEIQYNLLNSKFGVNIIGGFSSLFLNENKIFSEGNNSRTFIGEANNINNVSYSANLGLGLNYRISKKWDLNLEPMFKYQINTFENTSGNFKPYFIGIYTGFGFKF